MLIPTARPAATLDAVAVIAAGHGRPVQAAEIAAALGMAPRHLEASLQRLVHARILASRRGRHRGGYVLARPAHAISAAEIVALVVGGPVALRGISAAALADAEASAWASLSGVTLAELAEAAGGRGVAEAAE